MATDPPQTAPDRFQAEYQRRNPDEFPDAIQDHRERAQAMLEAAVPEAVTTLLNVMLHSESDKDRVSAAKLVVEFGIGKAAPTPVSTQAAKNAQSIIRLLQQPPKSQVNP